MTQSIWVHYISPNVPTTPSPAPVTTVATTPGTTTAPIAPIVPTRPGIGAIANKVTYHFKGKVINTASNPGNLDNLRISPNAADKDLDVNVTESTNLNKINATTGSYEVGLIIHNPQKLSTHKCYISVMTDNKVIKDTSQFPCTNGNTYIVEDISINYPKPLGPIEAATPTISIQNQKITINVVLNYQSVNCDSGKFWLSSIGTKYKDGNTVDYKRNFYFVSNQGNLTKKETHTLEFSKYPIRDITINTYALGYNNGVSKYISTPEKKYSTSINQNSISEQIEQDCSK